MFGYGTFARRWFCFFTSSGQFLLRGDAAGIKDLGFRGLGFTDVGFWDLGFRV